MMDFHCHLDLYPDAKYIYSEASKRNQFTWLVTTSPKAFDATSSVLKSVPNILITPGLHPEIAHDRANELPLLLKQISKVSAVGEVGLDGSPRYHAHYDIQFNIFDAIVKECADLGGKTLNIHSRKAVKDVLSILRQHSGYGTAILHWFSGSLSELKMAEAEGCWFSLGPAAFSSANGRLIAANVPRNKIVSESDGPFATLNKQSIMPWSYFETIKCFAKVWDTTEEEVAHILHSNSNSLLSIIETGNESYRFKHRT